MNPNEQFPDRLPSPDVTRLEQEVARRVEVPENRERAGREVVQEAVRALSDAQQDQDTSSGAAMGERHVLPPYAESAPEEVRQEVERLLQVAVSDGLTKAIRQARSRSPFILDAFHDALVDNLYPLFKERGLVP
jgi:hypothetical protein